MHLENILHALLAAMHFAQLTTSFLALATAGRAAMSSDTVVANVEKVTQLSADTNTIAVKINLLNFARYAPVLILPVCGVDMPKLTSSTASGQQLGPNRRNRYEVYCQCELEDKRDLVEDIDELTEGTVKAIWPKKTPGCPAVHRGEPASHLRRFSRCKSATQQQQLNSNMPQFVRVHQALLATVIGKHGLLSLAGFAH